MLHIYQTDHPCGCRCAAVVAVIDAATVAVVIDGATEIDGAADLIPNGQYASRVRECCSLFGCNHVVEPGRMYCSSIHENIAQELGSLQSAYVVIDGFSGLYNDKNHERDMRSVVSLLKSTDEGVNVAIPLTKDLGIFERVPWEWDFINFQFLDGEIDRSWLFFHPIKNPVLSYFDYNEIKWSSLNYYLHQYQRDDT
ncbi:hypothetical protein ISN45_Aa04g017160 [Arabidopsis thaliana x Arabidopsis arenosa]|uniref:Uncharacterized protein n=1 Tax=Arabidopsis thaliana x Arabidopsis arenosa TaxID=1240361 RepID=A0A8T2A8E6_9BRAS|nr:hypothetical protein ISN45_Aa04g017160 [Arabidopsis thaliana x Arabidopsis arenosa]